MKKLNLLLESIKKSLINEINDNSFYPAKYVDGTQAVRN